MSSEPTDLPLEELQQGLLGVTRGDPSLFNRLWSEREDVSLGNPFGPFALGRKQVMETVERAASNYRDGEIVGFQTVSFHGEGDLACLVQVERFRVKVGGADKPSPVSLRVTSLFRREHDDWKLVHRHADPITSRRAADSVIER